MMRQLLIQGGDKDQVRINSQNISGKTIHDDGAANFCRYQKQDFIGLSKSVNTKIIGVNGPVNEVANIGTIKDGKDVIRDVVYTPRIDYNIDSPFQMVDYYGWIEDKSTGPRTRRYYKTLENGQEIERTYTRKFGEPHLVRVNAQNAGEDKDIEGIEIGRAHV